MSKKEQEVPSAKVQEAIKVTKRIKVLKQAVESQKKKEEIIANAQSKSQTKKLKESENNELNNQVDSIKQEDYNVSSLKNNSIPLDSPTTLSNQSQIISDQQIEKEDQTPTLQHIQNEFVANIDRFPTNELRKIKDFIGSKVGSVQEDKVIPFPSKTPSTDAKNSINQKREERNTKIVKIDEFKKSSGDVDEKKLWEVLNPQNLDYDNFSWKEIKQRYGFKDWMEGLEKLFPYTRQAKYMPHNFVEGFKRFCDSQEGMDWRDYIIVEQEETIMDFERMCRLVANLGYEQAYKKYPELFQTVTVAMASKFKRDKKSKTG